MKNFRVTFFLLTISFMPNSFGYAIEKNPKAALEQLMMGNERYQSDKTICPARNEERRIASRAKQKPFAVILGCSDSRVSPEIIFDQGVGDIFVVRDAGNIVGDTELDSINYSVVHNESPVVLVLGHEKCGAIEAVLKNKADDIPSIAEHIKAGLINVDKYSALNLNKAIEENIKHSVEIIKKSPPIAERIKTGKVMVVGAYYHLKTGEVRLLD